MERDDVRDHGHLLRVLLPLHVVLCRLLSWQAIPNSHPPQLRLPAQPPCLGRPHRFPNVLGSPPIVQLHAGPGYPGPVLPVRHSRPRYDPLRRFGQLRDAGD